MAEDLPCKGCKYPGFRGFDYCCRHPRHPGAINTKQIMQNGGKCESRVDEDKKVMAGEEVPWPKPVNLEEEQHG